MRDCPQERVEGGELVVDRYPQSLKRAASGYLHVGLRDPRNRQSETDAQHPFEGVGGVERLLLHKSGNETGVWFVGVLLEHPLEIRLARPRHQLGGRLATVRVHAHVQGAGPLVAEATVRVVELHRRDAQVGQDHVHTFESFGGQRLGQTREVRLPRDELLRAEAGGTQTRFREG